MVTPPWIYLLPEFTGMCSVFCLFWGFGESSKKRCVSKDNLKALGQTVPGNLESRGLDPRCKTTAMLEPGAKVKTQSIRIMEPIAQKLRKVNNQSCGAKVEICAHG